jgi:hypothetical protein
MIEKEPEKNQSLLSPVTPGLQVRVDGRSKNGGARNSAGRPKLDFGQKFNGLAIV